MPAWLRHVSCDASADVPDNEINVGVFVAHSPTADRDGLHALAAAVAEEVRAPLERATGIEWHFHAGEPTRLADDDPRRPSDFLDEASLRMVEGPFDVVVVLTDVGVVSRRLRVEAGLASPVAHLIALSTRKLLMTPRGRPVRRLGDSAVRANAAALLLHLLGHVMGLRHERAPDSAMAPFVFDEHRRELPRFHQSPERLRARALALQEREWRSRGPVGDLWFHLASATRNLGGIARTLLRNRALFLALALPGLATAALTPTFILLFTAEIWDVGLNMAQGVAVYFSAGLVIASTWLLVSVQSLLFPRKERRLLTEHMAVVNAAIVLTVFLGLLGLFVMVGLLMLALELWVFPPGLISEWPTLEDPLVTLADKVRLAAFISAIGVVTGALAGGVDARTVIRHLALFLDEP